jgi:hypothetical protein
VTSFAARSVLSQVDLGALPHEAQVASTRGPRLLAASDGRTYVSRRIDATCVPGISAIAEYSAHEWATDFGVVVPYVSFVTHLGQSWIGSEYHETAAHGYDFTQVQPPEVFTSLVVFDCLLGNPDRTAPNLLVESLGAHDRVLLIDHENSTIATDEDVDPIYILDGVQSRTSRQDLERTANTVRSYFMAHPGRLVAPLRAAAMTCGLNPADIEGRVQSRLEVLDSIIDTLCQSRSIP